MSDLPSLGPRGEGWVAIQIGLLAVLGVAAPVTGSLAVLQAPGSTDAPGAPLLGVLLGAMAIALLLAGGTLAVRGVIDLRDALTPLPHPRADAELVEDGVYARARHPIYGGLILGAVGWALLWLSPAALALAGVLGAFFRLKSEREEAWLLERFPGYEAYRGRTRRFLPIPIRRAGG